MPFNEAKKIVKAKVAPTIEKKDVQMTAAYEVLKDKFNDHIKKASSYMAHADYPGHKSDRIKYLIQIRISTEKYLQKQGKIGEFLKYITNVDKRSDRLHETFAEKIKKREQLKFKELTKKSLKLTQEAKFDNAIDDMMALHMHLSPFNRTDKSGNIGEAFLRVDKQIEEKVNKLKVQKKLHSQLFKKGNVFETKDAKIYIDGTMDGGKVRYADIKGKSLKDVKPNEYKTVSWLALLRQFPPGKFELKRGGKAIDIKNDPDVAKSNAEIAELKLLKQINFFYSGGLEKFAKSPEDKKLLKAALSENLQKLSLYFDRDANGVVVPSKIYKMLPSAMKVKKLTAMMQGFQQIRMRMQLEGLLNEELGKGDEKDPSKVRFFKAEIDYQNGLHLSAYSKFQKYIKDNKNSQDEAVKRNVKIARGRLRQSSLYVITLAQRYSLACLNEPTGEKSKFHMREGFRNKVSKKLNKVFGELRRMMYKGEAKDLDEAYRKLKDKPEGALGVKVEEFGAKGLTETNFLRKHYSFVKTMITTLTKLTYDENQEDGLNHFAKIARKDKFRGATRVLLEEQMKRKLIARRRELMKDPKFRAKNREQFLTLASGKNQLGFEKVVNDFAKDLERKYPNLVKGVKLANKGLNATANFVTDIFSDKVSLSKVLSGAVSKAIGKEKPGKGLSKYENYSPFAEGSGIIRRAVEDAGGLGKYHALPLAKKKELYEKARMEIFLAQHQNNTHVTNVKGYIKEIMASEGDMSQSSNPVAYQYNDAFDPNNEFFNLSDEGWDFVEGLVGEIPIMAASAGAGNLVAVGIKQGAKRLATRMVAKEALKQTFKSAAFRLGVRGTAFVADLAVSEVVDRGMRYILRGEKPPMDISQLLAHSLGTYGSMKYASKAGQKMFGRLAEQGMAGKLASHALSTAAVEAPCMVAVNNLFGQTDGSILEQYGRALGTMLASKGSMSLLSASTGGAMMKAEQNYDVRESVLKIKDPWKKKVLNEMMRKNEISTDQLSTIMQSNLNFNQITKLRSLLNNPKSVKFLLAYEYAKSHGVDNQDLTHQYDYLIAQMVEEGLSRDDAHKLLDDLNAKKLNENVGVGKTHLDVYGPTTPKSHLPELPPLPKPSSMRSETPTVPPPKPQSGKPKTLSAPYKAPDSSGGEKVKSVNASLVDQSKLDKLAMRLKKIGLENFARILSSPDVNFMLSGGKDIEIKTYEQRVAEVKRLEELNALIKLNTEYLKKDGLLKEAEELENYRDRSKYLTLDERLKAAQHLVDGVSNLRKLGIPFKPGNAVELIDFVNGKSEVGADFKKALVNIMVARYFNDSMAKKYLKLEIDTTLIQMVDGLTPELQRKIVDKMNERIFKRKDREIFQANIDNMTPLMMQAIIMGGKEIRYKGETVRIYQGRKIGAGGLGAVHDVWYVRKPSNKIETGVVKIPLENSGDYFKYESRAANGLSKVLDKNPSSHLIKPIFSSNDVIIYKKIESEGKSVSLHDAVKTMSTQEWIGQFIGGVKGLIYLHEHGITHNDFKPDNIVVGKDPTDPTGKRKIGVLIDIGSFVFKGDVGKTILPGVTPIGLKGTLFKSRDMTVGLAWTPQFHNPEILSKSIELRKKNKEFPLDLGDKYAVGTSLLVMLAQKGYVQHPKPADDKTKSKPSKPARVGVGNHEFELKPDAPASVRKLYKLAQKLKNSHKHPYEFKGNRKMNKLLKRRDSGFISLKDAMNQIKQIAPTLPDNDPGFAKRNKREPN